MKNLEITRTAAIAIFAAIGISTAGKWNATRLGAKLAKLDDMIDEDGEAEDPAVQADIDRVLAADTITVTAAKAAAKEPKAKAAKEPKAKAAAKEPKAKAAAKEPKAKAAAKEPKAKAAAKEPKAAKEAAAKAKADAKEATAKADAKAAKEAAKAAKPAGIRETVTRAHCAGQVLAKYPAAAGIAPSMVEEVNELYGKDNDVESLSRLKNVWHGLAGFRAAGGKL
jgi:outer membrane biosynthesis protein TonB